MRKAYEVAISQTHNRRVIHSVLGTGVGEWSLSRAEEAIPRERHTANAGHPDIGRRDILKRIVIDGNVGKGSGWSIRFIGDTQTARLP